MANNRLYIRCKQCGKCIFIGKHFGGELFLSEYEKEPFIDRLNRFYLDHWYCNIDGIPYSLELCEEFPGEITDCHYDCYNVYEEF